MPVNFTALDFETANRSPASVCGVGLVRVRDGQPVAHDTWLIHPPSGFDHFETFNIQLHGISPERVAAAPGWPESLARILEFVGEDVLVAHNAPFDVGVLVAASRVSALPVPGLEYFCSLRLARKSFELPSYRLPSAAQAAGHTITNHHDPLADAEAAAAIVTHVASRDGHATLAHLAAASGVAIRALAPEDVPALDGLVAAATF